MDGNNGGGTRRSTPDGGVHKLHLYRRFVNIRRQKPTFH